MVLALDFGERVGAVASTGDATPWRPLPPLPIVNPWRTSAGFRDTDFRGATCGAALEMDAGTELIVCLQRRSLFSDSGMVRVFCMEYAASWLASKLPTLNIVLSVSMLERDFNANLFAAEGKRPTECCCSLRSISWGTGGMVLCSTACVAWVARGVGRRAPLKNRCSLLGFCEPAPGLSAELEWSDSEDLTLPGLRSSRTGDAGPRPPDATVTMGFSACLVALVVSILFSSAKLPRLPWGIQKCRGVSLGGTGGGEGSLPGVCFSRGAAVN
jgi:hypothetical protein